MTKQDGTAGEGTVSGIIGLCDRNGAMPHDVSRLPGSTFPDMRWSDYGRS